MSIVIATASAQFIQQGGKLVGTGGVGATQWQGYFVALSPDGNTALVGGRYDNILAGAAWVYTRIGNTWTQQGPKLVGTGAVGNAGQGCGVALSSDGNTALIGGANDNTGAGAAWVFTRTGNTWTQQGPKLVGTGAVGNAFQGYAVALSSDGNTAILGGYQDNANAGAAWVFTRTGNTWTQQGSKLFGTGAIGSAQQGVSVALSSDGNTAITGAWYDNIRAGAAWVFTRTGNTWTQQGSKLFGTGAIGNANQGYAVALSSNGNTALLGGYSDNTNAGAAWIFTRVGNTWTQQGPKLFGSGAVGNAWQGISVALSSDGNTALVGGYHDNADAGAAWAFTRIGNTWFQQGAKLFGTGAVGNAQQGNSVALSSNGNTALSGAASDNIGEGATWVFVRNGPGPLINLSRNNINRPILDNQNTFDTLTVTTRVMAAHGLTSGSILGVQVGIDSVIHPNDTDLEISLLHLGVNDTIVYRVGGSGDNFIGTVLDDSATTAIGNGSAPFTGQFKPTSPLSHFNTMDAAGAWVLKIFDRTTGNTGTLKAWSLSITVSPTTSVSPVSQGMPDGFRLSQNYPNPFNPTTRIRFQVLAHGFTSLKIYNMLGQEVTTLVQEELQPGSYETEFNATGLASGVYLYRLFTPSFQDTKKLMVVK